MEEIKNLPHQPGPEKRFSPSREDFSKDRLTALKASIDVLKQDDPAVLSFCMFGSMARGNPRPESDIDGYLFVEVPPVAERKGTESENLIEEKDSGAYKEIRFRPDMRDHFVAKFSELMTRQTDMTPEQVQDGIKVRPINGEIVRDLLDDYLTKKRAVSTYREANEKWLTQLSELTYAASHSTDSSVLSALVELQKLKPQKPETPTPSTTLEGMFHLDVGGGIREYRAQLINELLARGEEGEEVWKEIIRGTEMMENYLSTNKKKHYPRTLAEAQVVYGNQAHEKKS